MRTTTITAVHCLYSQVHCFAEIPLDSLWMLVPLAEPHASHGTFGQLVRYGCLNTAELERICLHRTSAQAQRQQPPISIDKFG